MTTSNSIKVKARLFKVLGGVYPRHVSTDSRRCLAGSLLHHFRRRRGNDGDDGTDRRRMDQSSNFSHRWKGTTWPVPPDVDPRSYLESQQEPEEEVDPAEAERMANWKANFPYNLTTDPDVIISEGKARFPHTPKSRLHASFL